MGKIRQIKPTQLWSDHEGTLIERPRLLYCITEIGCEATGPCKFGLATNMSQRLSSLQCGNWRELAVVWQVRISDRDRAINAEQHCLIMHRPNCYSTRNTVKRLKSEWVEATPVKALETALKYLNCEETQKFHRVA